MLLKRISSLVVGAFLLHLTVASNDLTCSLHGSHGVASAMAATSHAAMTAHDDAEEDKSCEIPVNTDCCRAHASCSVSLVLDAEVIDNNHALPASSVTLHLADLPVSPSQAPEPPPPKA